MKREARLIKDYLKSLHPEAIIQVKYLTGKGVLSMDGVLVTSNVPYDTLLQNLLDYTKGIDIKPKGYPVHKGYGICAIGDYKDGDVEYIWVDTMMCSKMSIETDYEEDVK